MNLAEQLVAKLSLAGQRVSTAESCTGGMLAAAITDVAGSSNVFDRGFVTYSNLSKSQMLGIPEELIISQGAVSERVARAMASGALLHSDATIAISITGIAGPSGGSVTKPVGLVHFAMSRKDEPQLHEQILFRGDRAAIRTAARDHALQMLLSALMG